MISNLVKASELRKVERDKCRECVGCEVKAISNPTVSKTMFYLGVIES
jgi:hypothetical protein